MEQNPIKVLVVDDDPVRDELKIYLEEEFGFASDAAANGHEALELASKKPGSYDVAIIDQGLIPKPDGITVMRELKAIDPDIECIIFTGKGIEERERAIHQGAFRYVEKNLVEFSELALLIRTAVQQARKACRSS